MCELMKLKIQKQKK